MINIKRTESDGRLLTGQTALGEFCVEWDGQGVLLHASIVLEEPGNRLTNGQVEQAERHAQACEKPCPDLGPLGVRRERGGHQLYRVDCKRCGCGGLDLVNGACPRGHFNKKK